MREIDTGTDELLARVDGGVAVLTLNRPERRNALSPTMLDALAGVLAERHGRRLARVLASSTFLVDEVPGGRERPLAGARQVDVLPPFAGG